MYHHPTCTRNKISTDGETAKCWEMSLQIQNNFKQFQLLFLADNLLTAEYLGQIQNVQVLGSGSLFTFFTSFPMFVETDIKRVEKRLISYALLIR